MAKKTPRTFKRLSYIALAFVKKHSEAAPTEAQVINLSYGGIAIYSREVLDGQVEVSVFYEDEGDKTVTEHLWGKIAWKKKVGSMIAYGVEFGNLNPEDHRITMSLMEDLLK